MVEMCADFVGCAADFRLPYGNTKSMLVLNSATFLSCSAVAKSKWTYEQIMEFIKSDPEDRNEE